MSSILRSAKVPAHTLALLIAASSAAVAQLGDYDPALEFPGLSQATLKGMHAAAAKLYLYEDTRSARSRHGPVPMGRAAR